MSIASNARASSIMSKASKGVYVKQSKFANFGSVVEDSIMSQQMEADKRLKEIQAQRKLRKIANIAWQINLNIVYLYYIKLRTKLNQIK